MRVFEVDGDGKFNEYLHTPFQVEHEEAVLEEWLESNPDGIVEDEHILTIGRQVTTNLGGFIDLLGVDRDGDVVVVELKRDRTPRETIAQGLEYASFVARLSTEQLEGILRSYQSDESLSLAEHHRQSFDLGPDEAVAFNKDQRIVIIGQRVTPEIRQTASFLRSKGLRVTCVEFAFFQARSGTRLLSQEIVVGREGDKPPVVTSATGRLLDHDTFLASLDDNGKAVFGRILDVAEANSMPIHWGTKGLSVNVDLGGTHVAVCCSYIPDSVYGQTFRTVLYAVGGVARKTAVPDQTIEGLAAQAKATGLFRPAGRELKCVVEHQFTEAEVRSLTDWCEAVTRAIRRHGLKG